MKLMRKKGRQVLDPKNRKWLTDKAGADVSESILRPEGKGFWKVRGGCQTTSGSFNLAISESRSRETASGRMKKIGVTLSEEQISMDHPPEQNDLKNSKSGKIAVKRAGKEQGATG